jgi:hypothetical protein
MSKLIVIIFVIALIVANVPGSSHGCRSGWSWEATGFGDWCNGPAGQTCALRGTTFGGVLPSGAVWCRKP